MVLNVIARAILLFVWINLKHKQADEITLHQQERYADGDHL